MKFKHLNHICNQICLLFCNIFVEKLSGQTNTKTQNASKMNDDRWNWPNLNDRIQVFRIYVDVKLAETIQCNQKSLFVSNELSQFLSGMECKKSSCHTKIATSDTYCIKHHFKYFLQLIYSNNMAGEEFEQKFGPGSPLKNHFVKIEQNVNKKIFLHGCFYSQIFLSNPQK